jgi:hypothetical protein
MAQTNHTEQKTDNLQPLRPTWADRTLAGLFSLASGASQIAAYPTLKANVYEMTGSDLTAIAVGLGSIPASIAVSYFLARFALTYAQGVCCGKLYVQRNCTPKKTEPPQAKMK